MLRQWNSSGKGKTTRSNDFNRSVLTGRATIEIVTTCAVFSLEKVPCQCNLVHLVTMLKRFAANSLWLAACLPDALKLRATRHAVAEAQRQLLLGYLQRNRETDFGKQHNFASIRSITEYQARVPLSTYETYAPYLNAISAGQDQVLTTAPVLLLEPTSGSTAATKLIPYTAQLKQEFQRALAAWLSDLYWREPRLLGGQAYWSISPVTQRNARTAGGVPIGFEDDSEYLSGWQRGLAQTVMAVPSLVRLIDEMEGFRYATLLFLLRSRALALISVWHPTFLTLLMQRLDAWGQQLAADITRGSLNPPTTLAPALTEQLRALNSPDPRRGAEIEAALRDSPKAADLHACLWPRLRLISCWADAHAAPYAAALAKLFPQAQVQGKGLLATEGFVSFPLWGQSGAALAFRSHFFEFLPAQRASGEVETHRPRLAHELETGQCYAVVLTTGGGLYRYQLHDLIEVSGHYSACPLLRFLGKAAHLVDWFGEKLNERHVAQALATLLAQYTLRPAFTLLACETESQPPAYVLFIEATEAKDTALLTIGAALETALQDNFHYRYCRNLGQLGAVRVFRLERGAAESYLAHCQAHGQRAGDIKPVLLHARNGWARSFQGEFITANSSA
jgi:hypothetical protein